MNELVNYLVKNIETLPPVVFWPGVLLIAWFVLRAVGHLFRLRLVSVIINLLYALIVALVMAQYGDQIAGFLLETVNQVS